jgi:hypothetical protein
MWFCSRRHLQIWVTKAKCRNANAGVRPRRCRLIFGFAEVAQLIGRQPYEIDQNIDRLFTGFLNPPLMHRGGIVTQQLFLLLTFMARTFGRFQR